MSDKEVIAAAEEIEQAGGRPSVRAVRQRIGYGSYRDIAAALRRRKEESGQAGESGQVPEAVRTAGREAAERLWHAACRTAEARLAAEAGKLQQDRRAMESELAELAVTTDTLIEQRDEARRVREIVESRQRKDRTAWAAAEADIRAQLKAAGEAVRRARAERDAAREAERAAIARAARLEGELAAAREALDRE